MQLVIWGAAVVNVNTNWTKGWKESVPGSNGSSLQPDPSGLFVLWRIWKGKERERERERDAVRDRLVRCKRAWMIISIESLVLPSFANINEEHHPSQLHLCPNAFSSIDKVLVTLLSLSLSLSLPHANRLIYFSLPLPLLGCFCCPYTLAVFFILLPFHSPYIVTASVTSLASWPSQRFLTLLSYAKNSKKEAAKCTRTDFHRICSPSLSLSLSPFLFLRILFLLFSPSTFIIRDGMKDEELFLLTLVHFFTRRTTCNECRTAKGHKKQPTTGHNSYTRKVTQTLLPMSMTQVMLKLLTFCISFAPLVISYFFLLCFHWTHTKRLKVLTTCTFLNISSYYSVHMLTFNLNLCFFFCPFFSSLTLVPSLLLSLCGSEEWLEWEIRWINWLLLIQSTCLNCSLNCNLQGDTDKWLLCPRVYDRHNGEEKLELNLLSLSPFTYSLSLSLPFSLSLSLSSSSSSSSSLHSCSFDSPGDAICT